MGTCVKFGLKIPNNFGKKCQKKSGGGIFLTHTVVLPLLCALILFIQTLGLYKSFTYLLTYLQWKKSDTIIDNTTAAAAAADTTTATYGFCNRLVFL